MPDEKPTVTVDLRDENEEWVQYARNQGRPHTDSEIDDQSLESASKRKLQQSVYRYLTNPNTIDTSSRLFSHHRILVEMSSLIVHRAENVDSIRDEIRDRLRSDEDVSAFELPERTRRATAKFLVEEVVGKAGVRRMAVFFLNKARKNSDCSEGPSGNSYSERLRGKNY